MFIFDLSSFVPLLLPLTHPPRLQQLLEERERDEEVVEEVEDARFVPASTLLLPFPSCPFISLPFEQAFPSPGLTFAFILVI